MGMSVPSLSMASGSGSIKNAWHVFLFEHFDTFEQLVSYLVADPTLVNGIMASAATHLEDTRFDMSDPSRTYDRARRALIGEAIKVLSQQRIAEIASSEAPQDPAARTPPKKRLSSASKSASSLMG